MRDLKSTIPFYIVLLFIAVIIGYNIWLFNARKVEITEIIESEEEFNALAKGNVLKYRSNIRCTLAFDPKEVDMNSLFAEIVERDTYIGSQMYEVAYNYTMHGSLYDVHFRFKDPAPHRTFFTKIRVKQIADVVRNYPDDYSKVKAVHDYLIILNKYVITMSGAFNTLYTGRSCCNGYAYSFYAIMEELGIPATCEFGGAHAWNRVYLDGEWYNIDLTWDDEGGRDVGYKYFLKCDADWEGHHHGGATATKSMEVTGKSAIDNYLAFPNYILILPIICIVLGIIIFFGYKIYKSAKEKNDFYKYYRSK